LPLLSDRRRAGTASQTFLRQARRALKTNSSEWRRIRAQVLTEEPLCRQCMAEDRITAATDVDHIDEDSHNNERSNLQSLCRSCHSRKTARAMAEGRI